MTLGEKITSLRNEQKMSQGDLAEKMGVSRQSISKWETDASVPELDKLVLLSEIFHISLDELVKEGNFYSSDCTEEQKSESEIPAQPAQIIKASRKGTIFVIIASVVLLIASALGWIFAQSFSTKMLSAVPFAAGLGMCVSLLVRDRWIEGTNKRIEILRYIFGSRQK